MVCLTPPTGLASISQVEVDAGVLQGRARPSPVAGQHLLREDTVIGRDGLADRSEHYGSQEHQGREAISHRS